MGNGWLAGWLAGWVIGSWMGQRGFRGRGGEAGLDWRVGVDVDVDG
jgi:hypothetical protein